MKRIGLIGGFYTEATIQYLRCFESQMIERFGGRHVARVLLDHVNGFDLEMAIARKDFRRVEKTLSEAGLGLTAQGAEAIILGGSVLHPFAERVAGGWPVPLLHVVDATGNALIGTEIKRVGLLGTRLPTEERVWQRRFERRGISATLASELDRKLVASIISAELSRGIVREESRAQIVRVVDGFRRDHARAVILIAPELRLALEAKDCLLPLVDATDAHTAMAITWATAEVLSLPAPPCAIAS